MEIEHDLFAGVGAESETPPEKPKSSDFSVDSVFAGLNVDTFNTPTKSSKCPYTKLSQPFKVSDNSIQNILKSVPLNQRPAEPPPSHRPVQQFGFMNTRLQQQSVPNGPTPSPSTRSPSTQFQHPDLVQEVAEGVKLIDTTQWHSWSRETWQYEIDPRAEAELEAERILAADEKARLTPEELESQSEEQRTKMAEIEKLIQRAKGAKFKVGLKEMALWKNEVQRVEAPEEITVQRRVYIPPSISVANFANLLKLPLGNGSHLKKT